MAPSKDSDKPTFHPAFGVTSIKNHVAITLEMDTVQYDVWAELFLNAARAFEVYFHLVDPAKDEPPSAEIDKALWGRLDAIVKQWLYATISNDILQIVVESGSTAKQTWKRIADLFNDNKNSRTVFLEQQLSSTHMDDFPNVSSYCQAVKRIADQLKNVGSPIEEYRLVLHTISNLSPGFESIATVIQHSDPLPSFLKTRSMLQIDESRRAKDKLKS